jgi:chitinase
MAERGPNDAANLAVLTGLKKDNPTLQVVVSVGGGDTRSVGFSDMAVSAEGRKKFVDSVVATVEKYGLDGVDVDWEYRATRMCRAQPYVPKTRITTRRC